MPDCQPFYALRYNPEKVDLTKVVAPQYDVVLKEEISFYQGLSPYNSFHLELAEDPVQTRRLLQIWKDDGILIREESPSIYYYELQFNYLGRDLVRHGFIFLVKLSTPEEEMILPHERTFSCVKEERLRLLKETNCYFSQIFGLYEDKDLWTLSILPQDLELIFEVSFKQSQGILSERSKEKHRLYRLTCKDSISGLLSFLLDKPIYIADGHHRYYTALTYMHYLQEELKVKEPYDFHYAPFYLCPFEEESLLMLPTHRQYLFPLDPSLEEGIKNFAEVLRTCDEDKACEILHEYADNPSVFMIVAKGKATLFRLKDNFLKERQKASPILAKVPLHNFLSFFEGLICQSEEELKATGKVNFISNFLTGLGSPANEEFFVLFPRVSPRVLRDVVSAGLLMPHKSTYFYPKVLTGTVFYEVKRNPITVVC